MASELDRDWKADGPELAIRELREADLPTVVAVERASFPTPWSERAFRSLLGRPDALLLVAEREGRVVGHAASWFVGPEAELADLAVEPSARRQGIGRALIEAVRQAAAERGVTDLYLQVRVSNVAARRVYASQGFRAVGRRRSYYRSPREDALVLRLAIDPSEA